MFDSDEMFCLQFSEELVKPSFGTELNNCEVLLGGNAKFACTVDGKPEPRVKWYVELLHL